MSSDKGTFIAGHTRKDGVYVKSHWRRVKKKIQSKEAPNLLLKVAFWIEQKAKLLVTDLGIIDTGFYRNSMYVSGVGTNSYNETPNDGKYKGKTGRKQQRNKAPERSPDEPNNAVVVGFAAIYAYWLEQKNPVLMKVLSEAKAKFGGKGVTFTIKDPK